jgi:hypothetical protein
VTCREARRLVAHLKVAVEAVVAHADIPTEPAPGTFLRALDRLYPEAAMVVVSARFECDIGPLPEWAILLSERFDRQSLLEAIGTGSAMSMSALEE